MAGTTAVGRASACPEGGGDAAGSGGAASSVMEDCGCAASAGANGTPGAGPPSSCLKGSSGRASASSSESPRA
eukprot:9882279-Alexandrium_andersonii.AAC.1